MPIAGQSGPRQNGAYGKQGAALHRGAFFTQFGNIPVSSFGQELCSSGMLVVCWLPEHLPRYAGDGSPYFSPPLGLARCIMNQIILPRLGNYR